MRRTSVYRIIAAAILVLFAQAAWASDALTFFNNWFVTGDYAVAGVGLRGTGVNGWATGTINMTDVPAGAEPVAAFLYWSTVETTTTPNARDGYFNGHQIRAAVLGDPTNPNPACWSNGGTTGPKDSAGRVYRADVLRYLPVNASNVRQANGAHTVRLPDSGGKGNGNVLYTNGASLVVVYRVVVAGTPSSMPLRAVVIYNGAFTMDKKSSGVAQVVAGFYQADVVPSAKITGIAANGQPGHSSPFSVNGTTLTTNPFVGAQGDRWDNPTYNFDLAGNASSFSTLLTVGSNQTCLTSVAIIASLNVKDSDADGLLDLWETSGLHRNTQVSPATFGTCANYPSDTANCVNLPAMGALNGTRDIFVQLDWMHGTGDGTGGTDGHGTHVHKPKLEALKPVADAFALRGVRLHYDVGNNYQGVQPACGGVCSFIVPSAYAQGGSDMDESTLVCHDTATHTCSYHAPYPVLSFEFGFASVRDGNHLLGISQHFAQNRKDIFHYGLFAHALGGPYDVSGHPVDPSTGEPTTIPRSYSGIAHRPGGGFMVTFGLWRSDLPENDQVGGALAQAGTIMHELGHNLDLSHGGLDNTPTCMPDYFSVMNYLYQTRGLTDAFGFEHIDYSNGTQAGSVNENSLFITNLGTGASTPYRVRFYGPLAPGDPPDSAAQLHCGGSPISPGETPLVRLESPAVGTPDWSHGTVPLGSPISPLDVNFNGTIGGIFTDQHDWLSLNLQQIGSGYRFGGLSLGAFATDGGVFATDGGVFATDAGAFATDGGVFATDGGAFATDGGAFATDGGVFATDGGVFATDGGAFATDAGELDYDTAVLSSVDPPIVAVTNTIGSIMGSLIPPDNGNIASYNIYRCAGAGCTPAAPAFRSIAGGTATPTFIDTVNDFVHAGASCPASATCYNTVYRYTGTSVALLNSKLIESVFSQPPVDSEVKHQFVIADSKTVTYDGTNQSVTFQIYGDSSVALNPSSVSCTTAPTNPARNAQTYMISCSGPAQSSPTDGVTYNAAYLSFVPGSLTINKRPITVTAAGSTKVYDGTINSPATPTITLGSLGTGDSVTWTESYDNKNVGNTHVMTPAGIVSDTNGGNNYIVTFAPISTGEITKRPITVTAAASTKTYDGTTSSTSTPTITVGTLASPDTAAWTESYDNKNMGNTHVMTPAGTVGDGNGGNNYNVMFAPISTGVIERKLASVTPNPASKIYSMPDPPFTGVLNGFVAADGITATYSRTTGESVTAVPYTISATLAPAGALGNYMITYNTATFVINPYPLTVTATGINKQFDGTVSATVTLSDNRLDGAFVASYASASFADPNPGMGKAVAVTGISISGPGASNYALTSTTAATTADISNTINLSALSLHGSPAPHIDGSALRLTDNTGETSSAWLPTAIQVSTAFSTSFQFRITPVSGGQLADGFAFVIQSAPGGNATLGTTGLGGYIGYAGIPNSIAVEFDTYRNTDYGDPAGTHIGIQSNGAAANSSSHSTSANKAGPVAATFADGAVHTATITYDGTSLSVLLDSVPVATAPVNLSTLLTLSGGTNAYVGFTAATGAAREFSDIVSWHWN